MAEGRGNGEGRGLGDGGPNGGATSKSGGGGGEEERIRLSNFMAQHINVTQLSNLDFNTPAGLASLSAILGQALQTGLAAGENVREIEARNATQLQASEKRKKKRKGLRQASLPPRP